MINQNSVADTVLSRYNFQWKLNPYRIEDVNGSIIQSGPTFDLSENVLKEQKERAERRVNNLFKVSQHPSKD